MRGGGGCQAGAEELKGSSGAAADREIGHLQKAEAGVEEGGVLRAEVGAGIDPGYAGLVEEGVSMPAGELNDGDRGAEVLFAVEEAGELAEGHTVACGDGHEVGVAFEAGIRDWAGDGEAVGEGGAIDDDEFGLCGGMLAAAGVLPRASRK